MLDHGEQVECQYLEFRIIVGSATELEVPVSTLPVAVAAKMYSEIAIFGLIASPSSKSIRGDCVYSYSVIGAKVIRYSVASSRLL